MMNYIYCLYNQFCEARGKSVDYRECTLSKEFVEWLHNNANLLMEYVDYLKILGFDYVPSDTIEVGKGRYDTLASFDFHVVSDFWSSDSKNNPKFVNDNGLVLLKRNREIYVPRESVVLTHNPYFEEQVANWHLIHNSGNKLISVGVFGNLYDANIRKKVVVLEGLANRMDNHFSFDYDTDGDKYFGSLNSQEYVKVLKKSR